MKYKHIILCILFFALLFTGGMVAALDQDPGTAAGHTEGSHVHEDERHDTHRGNHDQGHDNDHNAEGDNELHDDHAGHGRHDDEGKQDRETGIIELTQAQIEESGLTISRAVSGKIDQMISLVGEIRVNQDRMVHLVPLVSGVVHSVNVSLGDEVRKGQILATLDSPELAELKADYLEKIRGLELARRTFERKEYLKGENIASEADWLEAQASFHNADTLALAARRRLMALGLSEEEITAIPEARDEAFSRYKIIAPISGTIITRHITMGEKIDGEEVFTIADLSRVWVDLQIPANDIWRIREGDTVQISSPGGRTARGELTLVGPVIDEESRSALGRVLLANPEGTWKPGLFVNGQVIDKESSSAVVVSSHAIQNIEGENVIFVPSGHGYKPVEVTLGKTSRDKTEILSGLKAGAPYVAEGAFTLKAVKVTSGIGSHAGHGH